MNDSTSVTASPASFHFNLKTLLLAVAAVRLDIVRRSNGSVLSTCHRVLLRRARRCLRFRYGNRTRRWSCPLLVSVVSSDSYLVFGLIVFFLHALRISWSA